MIGMFVNLLPYRIVVDPHAGFCDLLQQVHQLTIDVLQHSYLPYQYIIGQHQQRERHSMPSIHFQYESLISSLNHKSNKQLTLTSDTEISLYTDRDWSHGNGVALFDLGLTVSHDHNLQKTDFTLECSADLFTSQEQVNELSSRFQQLLRQIFINTMLHAPIYELSLILPNEKQIYLDLNGITNTTTVILSSTTNSHLPSSKNITTNTPHKCRHTIDTIHQLFYQQIATKAQKIAVELDEQSLTYDELFFYTQRLALCLIEEYDVKVGDIVCQCVERSISMVIGIMGIEMSGAVYCPLSPRDPEERLHMLVRETNCRVVLVHWLTGLKFAIRVPLLCIDDLLSIYHNNSRRRLDILSELTASSEAIAYTIFTSGSTGTPKAAMVRHRNFVECIRALVSIGKFDDADIVIQMARCSFDIHLSDILGTLIVGATLVMLHPKGNLDFDYLALILLSKQITMIQTVPTLLNQFFQYNNGTDYVLGEASIKNICSSGELIARNEAQFRLPMFSYLGEPFPSKMASLLKRNVPASTRIWNFYGPAEATIDCSYYELLGSFDFNTVPIGKPIPNYCCVVFDKFSQPVPIDQEGELFIGGSGIFAGYLGRDDLTAKALIDIDGNLFYRTGDIVKVDDQGLIHYVGRKDFQVKLHGQRIELGEIERCLLELNVSACVVTKWGDDHLVAYVQGADISVDTLRDHCAARLPPFMVPSLYVVLDEFPLNANGKLDRKRLPSPNLMPARSNCGDCVPRSVLEKQLQEIFSQAFHVDSPDLECKFGEFGVSSIDVMVAVAIIRQKVCDEIDIGLLLSNPSIRQLAEILEPLVSQKERQNTSVKVVLDQGVHDRMSPSLFLESFGIAVLVCQWLLPIMLAVRCHPSMLLVVPFVHLMSYPIWLRLLSSRIENVGRIFSSSFYCWWFLDRLWRNNTFWLRHLLGTPFYNSYLRLCGAHIDVGTHIYTTAIDAPWVLRIGKNTLIADHSILNCLSYLENDVFELHKIHIGSHCLIGTRCVLHDGVDMDDNIIVQPMSPVTGHIKSETLIDGEKQMKTSFNILALRKDRSFSCWQTIYQIISLLLLSFSHFTLLVFIYHIYQTLNLPAPISFAICWTMWSFIGLCFVLILLKFLVGSFVAGEKCVVNSWLHLHKIWLRQLIVSSFHYTLSLVNSYDPVFPIVLRWLGAQIGSNIKLAEIDTFLSYPTNLLRFETGVTAFGYVLLVPTEITMIGECRMDYITLGAHINLGNGCSVLPGTDLKSATMIGNLTRTSRETDSHPGSILIGAPARVMPFDMPSRNSTIDEIKAIPLWFKCLCHLSSNCALVTIYSLAGILVGSIMHTALYCVLYRWRSYLNYSAISYFTVKVHQEYEILICPFLGNTQWLIRLFRLLGARIGTSVLIPDCTSLRDFDMISIGDNVRLNFPAYIMCHSYEQRIWKVAPVKIGDSCVLMCGSLIMPGCILSGGNRLYPYTMVMKNDHLPLNTHWRGLPARK
ncbi:unnamed protein product [Rotaria socialis]|uniref:Carrier domain-containing protein n=1 Tax=Rotaria socialis TaxID=392032 RepID=A0A818FE13_9BILA|nr:unnamed protein product [Rotaria socialis]CAF4582227.1 unnamed protein product [Rotaria socialis]